MACNMDITSRRSDDLADAPTPQNTPANNQAPITGAAQQPNVDSIPEGQELESELINVQKLGSFGKSKDKLPENISKRITGLKGIQKEQLEIEAELQRQIFELEKSFLEKFKPFFEKRARIINGQSEPTEAEINEGYQVEQERAEEFGTSYEMPQGHVGEEDISGIPEFWLTALKNCITGIQDTITSRDEDALKYLVDIRYSYFDKPGFCLNFEFKPNEYFTNQVLRKQYIYKDQFGKTGDYIYDHAVGDEIDWKTDKNLTITVETKKQRNKNTHQTRYIKRTIPCESFFNFFSPPVVEDDSLEISSELQFQLETDYQIGEEIKDKLIPRAVDWYTGEAELYDELLDGGDQEDEEYEDYSEDNESDGDSDEEESDEEATGKPRNDNSECRQQ